MMEILAAVLVIVLAWSSYDTKKRLKELEDRISRLRRKIAWK